MRCGPDCLICSTAAGAGPFGVLLGAVGAGLQVRHVPAIRKADNFRALCGANVVTLRSKFRTDETLELHRVVGEAL